MSVEVDVIVTRHAKPTFDKDFLDPGIDIKKEQSSIDKTARLIAITLKDRHREQLCVYSSPKRRAIETARALINTPDLIEMVNGEITPDKDLDEHSLDSFEPNEFFNSWNESLSRFASLAIKYTTNNIIPALLVVTHESVMYRIPELKWPNTDYLGVNAFSTSIDLLNQKSA